MQRRQAEKYQGERELLHVRKGRSKLQFRNRRTQRWRGWLSSFGVWSGKIEILLFMKESLGEKGMIWAVLNVDVCVSIRMWNSGRIVHNRSHELGDLLARALTRTEV